MGNENTKVTIAVLTHYIVEYFVGVMPWITESTNQLQLYASFWISKCQFLNSLNHGTDRFIGA